MISEHFKNAFNLGEEAPLYFWRDQHGNEVDLVIDQGTYLDLIEIKSGQAFQPAFLKNLKWLAALQGEETGTLIYGGNESFKFQTHDIKAWTAIFPAISLIGARRGNLPSTVRTVS